MTYKNPFHSPNYSGSYAEYSTEHAPLTEYRGFQIYHQRTQEWHIVKDGLCVGMMAGINGAKQRIDKYHNGEPVFSKS